MKKLELELDEDLDLPVVEAGQVHVRGSQTLLVHCGLDRAHVDELHEAGRIGSLTQPKPSIIVAAVRICITTCT